MCERVLQCCSLHRQTNKKHKVIYLKKLHFLHKTKQNKSLTKFRWHIFIKGLMSQLLLVISLAVLKKSSKAASSQTSETGFYFIYIYIYIKIISEFRHHAHFFFHWIKNNILYLTKTNRGRLEMGIVSTYQVTCPIYSIFFHEIWRLIRNLTFHAPHGHWP